MEDFRMKLQYETAKLSSKISEGKPLTPEECKLLFLATFLSEEESE